MPSMRRRMLWTGVAVAAFGGVTAYLVLRGGDATPCTGVNVSFDQVWNDGRRKALREAHAHIEIGYAADAWARADERFAAYAERWKEARLETCNSTEAKELRTLRAACLDDAWLRMDAVLAALAEPDPNSVAEAPLLARSLPPLEHCRVLVPPQVPVERVQHDPELLEAVRRGLAMARARIDVSTNVGARDEVERHSRHAETDAGAKLQAEGSLLLARMHVRQGQWDEAIAALDEAAKLAGRDRESEHQLEIALLRVDVALAKGDVAEARRAQMTATAAMQRGQLRPWMRWRTEHADALVSAADGDLPGALKAARTARDAAQGQYGDEDPRTAAMGVALGDLLARSGKHDEARKAYDRARARYEAALGKEHPAAVAVGLHVGALQRTQGNHPAAIETIETALDGLQSTLGPRHPRVADAIAELGRTHAEAGDMDEARRLLSNALALRKQSLGEAHPVTRQTQAELDRAVPPPAGDTTPP